MDPQIPDYLPIVTFDASTCTAESYRIFIEAIRGTASVHNANLGMPELAPPDEANPVANFFLINLTSFNYSIYLVCRKKNLYLVAYTTATFRKIRFFSDTDSEEMKAVFPEDRGYDVDPIGMQASYQYLVDDRKIDVVFKPIGISDVQAAIKHLANEGVPGSTMATSTAMLLVLILEPVRLVRLFTLVSAFANHTNNVHAKFIMKSFHNVCINNWGSLSQAIRDANPQTGRLKKSIILAGSMYSGDPAFEQVGIHQTYSVTLSSVADVQTIVAVLNCG